MESLERGVAACASRPKPDPDSMSPPACMPACLHACMPACLHAHPPACMHARPPAAAAAAAGSRRLRDPPRPRPQQPGVHVVLQRMNVVQPHPCVGACRLKEVPIGCRSGADQVPIRCQSSSSPRNPCNQAPVRRGASVSPMCPLPQTDVTARVLVERRIAAMLEAEHQLLEGIFPR